MLIQNSIKFLNGVYVGPIHTMPMAPAYAILRDNDSFGDRADPEKFNFAIMIFWPPRRFELFYSPDEIKTNFKRIS